MPTMISKKLDDLESERESFLLHERRIILERDEILKNLRNHLDQLDAEIVRLGGDARDVVEKNVDVSGGGSSSDARSVADDDAGALLLALADGGGFAPSVAPFPSVSSTQKKSRGRSRRSDEAVGVEYDGKGAESENNDANPKKGRGRPRKESVAEITGIALSNNASTPNDKNESSFDSVRAGTDVNFGKKPSENDTKDKGTPKKKKRRKKPPLASPAADDHTGEAWVCECGENMAAGRARCGKCRRWKGGKRQKRWSIKDRGDASVAIAGKKNTVAKTAIDAYRNLCPPVELELATDGAAIILANLAVTTEEDPRSEVDAILGQMVSAVTSFLDLNRPKKTRGPGKKKAVATTNTLGKDEQTIAKKRKRGRPRKDADKAQEQHSIQRVVSTSDSDSSSATEAPRKRGRPRKNPVADDTIVEPGQAEKARGADGNAGQAPKQSHLGASEAKTIPAAAVAKAPAPASERGDKRERIASDCLEYFGRVKQTSLADSPRTHEDLVKVVAEFKSRKVDTVGLVCRVMTLLDGRDDLILGVNAFLPDVYKIDSKDLMRSASR